MAIFREEFSNAVEKDIDYLNKNTISKAPGLWDATKGAFISSIKDGATGSLYNIAKYYSAENDGTSPKLTHDEANSKYSLEGTPYAFSEQDTVNEAVAELRQKRMFDAEITNFVNTKAEQQYGGLVSLTNFVSGVAGGFFDPISVATGVGTGKIVQSAFAKLAPSMGLKAGISNVFSYTKNMSKPMIFARESLSNLVATSTVDAGLLALHREKYGEEFTSMEFAAMAIGSAALGGAIGTFSHIKQMKKLYGDDWENAVKFQLEYDSMAQATGGKKDPGFIGKFLDHTHYSKRDGQMDYTFNPDRPTYGEPWYIAEYPDGRYAKDTDVGTGVAVLVDHPHLMENRIISLDGNHKIDPASVKLHKMEFLPNLKVLPRSGPEFEVFKGAILEGVRARIEEISAKDIKKLLNDATTDMKGFEARNLEQLSSDLRAKYERFDSAFFETEIKNAESLEELSDIVDLALKDSDLVFHNTLAELGYNGYRMFGKGADGEFKHNALVVLDSSAFNKEGGPRAMFMGSKHADLDSDFVKVLESKTLTPPDPDVPANKIVADQAKKMLKEETERMLDPRNQEGIDLEDADIPDMAEVNAKAYTTEEDDIAKVVVEKKASEKPKKAPKKKEGEAKAKAKAEAEEPVLSDDPVVAIDQLMKDDKLFKEVLDSLDLCRRGSL